MKKLALLILIDLAIVLLLGVARAIRWTGDSCLWCSDVFVSALGRVGSPIAQWTQDISDYGERVLQSRADQPPSQSR